MLTRFLIDLDETIMRTMFFSLHKISIVRSVEGHCRISLHPPIEARNTTGVTNKNTEGAR